MELKKINALKSWTNAFSRAETRIQEAQIAFEFYELNEMEESECEAVYQQALEAVETLEFRNMMNSEEDRLGVIFNY